MVKKESGEGGLTRMWILGPVQREIWFVGEDVAVPTAEGR